MSALGCLYNLTLLVRCVTVEVLQAFESKDNQDRVSVYTQKNS